MILEIKKMLMKDKINYDEVKKLFCYNFEKVVDDFFDVLYDLCNNKKNDKKLEDIFLLLKKIIIEFDTDKLDVIVIKCLELNSKIKNNNIVNSFLNDIYYENCEQYKLDMIDFLDYLIYKDKSVKRIKIFLNFVDKTFLSCEQLNMFLQDLLNKFNTKDREIKQYYYKVAILLLDKIGNNLLSKNRDKYLNILDELKVHSRYSDDLYSLISGKYISDNILMDRFGIQISFPYKYDSFGINIKDKEIPNLRQGAITIDNNNTLKMDDALFFKKNRDNTYTLYVHVSFVPSLISYDSIINQEARRRYKSLFAFEKVVPIIPNDLVLNNFSLVKNVYRNVVTFSIKIDSYMNIIPDTLKIERTNVRVVNNFDYDNCDFLIKNNCDDNVGTMLRNLVVFGLKCHENIDVHKALVDNDYLNGFLGDNISRDTLCYIMRNINHCIAKYFRDRKLPYLYKYTCFMEDDYSNLMKNVKDNKSIMRYDKLFSDLSFSFLEVKLSDKPKSFFEFDCYSSSTSPLWKYSSLYNQYLINNFIFCKKVGTDYVEEWYNITRDLAGELNLQKQKNKDIETVCKSLGKIRSRY